MPGLTVPPYAAVRLLCVLAAVALHALLCFATFTGKREAATPLGSATKALRLVDIREAAPTVPELNATQTSPAPDAAPMLPIDVPAETVVPVAELALPEDFFVPASLSHEIERESASADASQNASRTQGVAQAGYGSGGSSQTQAYLRHNFDALLRKIRRALVYPPQAKKAGIQGTVEVVFTVRADGTASGVSVSKSSGEPLLDAAAVAAIVTASPFPPPPSPVKLAVPIVFVLK
ncbi:TonB family protein [Treponema endosymbiont of Eucomonympha sp.]|uniref:TonB family protein n=1 Tax=Treponema endosymbiont of Eucomonympha sp. TaxID=1580831 RepID=UPI00075141FD|nr:TonB family protein [Treponema endosymbiont of Eucomonympha sp.]